MVACFGNLAHLAISFDTDNHISVPNTTNSKTPWVSSVGMESMATPVPAWRGCNSEHGEDALSVAMLSADAWCGDTDVPVHVGSESRESEGDK